MAGFENGRLQTAARAIGKARRRPTRRPKDYAGDRKVFGEPIAEYQLTRCQAHPHGRHHPGASLFTHTPSASSWPRAKVRWRPRCSRPTPARRPSG
ncbi:MAG: acyl-CoA dehydrogenase family protein [Acidimicrobiales bacterium]